MGVSTGLYPHPHLLPPPSSLLFNYHQNNNKSSNFPPDPQPPSSSGKGAFPYKMNVLKKVKKRFRRSGRGGENSGNQSGNNLPPLLFHQVHGDNVRVSRDGRVAKRVESFCKGVTFSARPVKISEKICVKFLDISNSWSGVLRFGFTSNDPSMMRYSLPKYACPDLTNKPGYWAKAMSESLCEKDTILFYYVTSSGDVHFGVNGEEKGVFFNGVDTRGQLWAMIDIYGNSTVIEFLDSRQQLNNRHSTFESGVDVERCLLPLMSNLSVQSSPHPNTIDSHSQQGNLPSQMPSTTDHQTTSSPPLRLQNPSTRLNPLPFHRTRGRNVRMSNDRSIATRSDTEFNAGYVFTSRPLLLGERIVVQVLSTEPMYVGGLALGFTSCDPGTLTSDNLPEDSDLLLDRPEYWVVSKDVTGTLGPEKGDELSFGITLSGQVQFSRNGGSPTTLMHVDHSLTLWAFLDLFGATQKVRILGSFLPPPSTNHQIQLRNNSQMTANEEGAILRSSMNGGGSSPPRMIPLSQCCQQQPLTVTTSPGVGGGTVLVVNLPPLGGSGSSSGGSLPSTSSILPPPPPGTSSHQPQTTTTLLSNCSHHTYVEPVVLLGSSPSSTSADCSICYERAIDSVLYTCGHMCMCYECARQQWKGKGGGHCPICRAVIRDVIRTFKS